MHIGYCVVRTVSCLSVCCCVSWVLVLCVVGCVLRVAGCVLTVWCCLSVVVCSVLHVACCLLLIACWLLVVVHWLSPCPFYTEPVTLFFCVKIWWVCAGTNMRGLTQSPALIQGLGQTQTMTALLMTQTVTLGTLVRFFGPELAVVPGACATSSMANLYLTRDVMKYSFCPREFKVPKVKDGPRPGPEAPEKAAKPGKNVQLFKM